MPRAEFVPTIPVFERSKTVRVLDREAGGTGYDYYNIFIISNCKLICAFVCKCVHVTAQNSRVRYYTEVFIVER
jgi:hypothetical protein